MNRPAPGSRELLERMLAKVEEMRHSLATAEGAAGAAGGAGEIDVGRAMAALDDLERRVRQMLAHHDEA